MQTINLRSFRQAARSRKTSLRYFLSRISRRAPRGFSGMVKEADRLTWLGTDCKHCANCCKTMSPTYSQKDIVRIAGSLGMRPAQFRDRWLIRDRQGDWINQSNPCQFLDLENNHCRIYEVRPADCAGFPHHGKKLVDYLHVYKQNLEHCPATYRMLTRLQEMVRRPAKSAPEPVYPA